MMNHDGDVAAMDVSSLPSSSPSSPLTPLPFEYTPPTNPFNPQTFFLSDIMHPGVPPPTAATLSYQEQDMVIESSWLTLSLPPLPQPLPFEYRPLTPSISPPNATTSSNSEGLESPQTIQPPFPWATLKPATVHTLDHLLFHLNINTISGTLECKSCNFQQTDFRFDLLKNFEKVANFIMVEKHKMCNRAPEAWMKPVLPNCENCGRKSTMQPFIGKEKEINWLFLLLGEMIGCCNLEHLKYFCKHADMHKTGAKDRLLYQTYLGLCKQLQPEGPFDL
ncbi:hypothetical protein RYX36_014905 [Vicia faba]